MRASEIIRSVLDLIDQVESADQPPESTVVTVVQEPEPNIAAPSNDIEEMSRLKQIVDLLPDATDDDCGYSNSANEKYASIDSVLASGTDLLKSKNPSDIRGEHASMYPLYQHDPREE